MSDHPKRRARWLLMAFVAVMVSVLTVAWTSLGAGRVVSEQAEELAGQRIPELREIAELSYLQRFPIDTLKIDQAFVRTMGSSPEDAAIVSLIMSLAKSLCLKVVAEGVETPGQQAQLSALDCDLLQGYLFSKPIPAAEFALRLLAVSASETGPAAGRP